VSPYESRPAGAAPESSTKTTETSIVLTAPQADEYARRVDGAYCVVVRSPNGRLHRRVFLTVASAQRAVESATARGLSSRIVLAELKPLFDVTAAGGPR
jgi:hypothetical protein